jgi:predicted RNase H-like HicB family nuclease
VGAFVEAPYCAHLLGVTVAEVLAMQQDVLAVSIGYQEGRLLAEWVRREEAESDNGTG